MTFPVLLLGASQLDIDSFAIGGLIAALASAWASVRVVGPNRRKVIEEAATNATTRATSSLEAVLDRYEADNERLREDFDELEKRLDSALERLRNVTAERDALTARVERMSRQLAEAGIQPAT